MWSAGMSTRLARRVPQSGKHDSTTTNTANKLQVRSRIGNCTCIRTQKLLHTALSSSRSPQPTHAIHTPLSNRVAMSTPRGGSVPRGAGSAVQTPTTGQGNNGKENNRLLSSAGPASVGGTYRTPNTATKVATGRRTPGTAGRTPHARAARLALDSRRTAIFTPGGRQRQSRRKSGRMLRDSPRDLLRNLSRRLAPTSQPIASSSPGSGGSAEQSRRHRQPLDIDMEMDAIAHADSSTASVGRRRTLLNIPGLEDDDDSLPLDRPRMSLNIEDNDNDDDLRPHRSLILENGGDSDDAEADADADLANFTQRSIELARRAATQEQLLQARRFSRASLGMRSSLGSMRMSDYMDEFGRGAGGGEDGDVAGDDNQPSAFFPEGAFDNLMPGEGESGVGADLTFERVDSDTGEQHEARLGIDAGGESGFGLIDLGLDGGNETTFMMGQQSPDRTLGTTVLLEGDGEDNLGLLNNGDNENGIDFGAPFGGDNFDDYGGGNESGGGNFWDDDEPDNANGAEDVAVSAHDAANNAVGVAGKGQEKNVGGKKRLKLSSHGIPYPSLPVGVVKRIAQTFAQSSGASSKSGKAKLSPETVAALSTASDWFFEQVGVDLQRYAKHAGRKTIDESDVLLLMRRQRQVNAAVTPFSLAQRMLPRELLQELRMIPDVPALKRRSQKKPSAQRLSGVGRIAKKRADNVT